MPGKRPSGCNGRSRPGRSRHSSTSTRGHRGTMAKSSFLRHAAVYGAGDVLVYAAGFLLLPLYGRCLSLARLESLFFTLISVGQFVVRVTLCIVLVTVVDWGIRGVLLASASSAGLFAGWLLLREIRRSGLRIDGKQLRAMFWFALPFV